MMAVNKERYYCPECGAFLIWCLVSRKTGANSEVSCGNNVTSSRIDWNSHQKTACFWKGLAIRNQDGSVAFYEKNGVALIRPFASK